MSDVPPGKRFSHVYLAGGEPVSDSKRMRMRLGSVAPPATALHRHLAEELGVYVSHKLSGRYGPSGIDPKFFVKAELRDVLDTVTLTYNFTEAQNPGKAARWLADVRRIFAEENLSYSVDDQGGVHYSVDSTFEAVRASVIAGLGTARYGNVRSMYDHSLRAMDAVPPDCKTAIRSTFAAVEGLFRVMYPSAPRLGAAEVEKYLVPDVASAYHGDVIAQRAAAKLLGSLTDWIDGAHFYRHEPGHEEVSQPPLALAVLIIQEGSGFLRWLVHLDQQPR